MKELFEYIHSKGIKLKQEPLKKSDLDGFDLKLNEAPYKGNLFELIDSIFDKSINTQSPRFLNQLYGGADETAWLGELLVAVLNTSMATTEIAPLATQMELEIIRAINEKSKFPKVHGLIVPGGSYANMMGIHCARYAHNSSLKKTGLYQNSKLKVFVSKDAHYSSLKSMNLMGLGTENLVKVELDSKRKIDVAELEKQIELTIEQGDVPLCVVSTAGTTVWGAFDPIAQIQSLCEKYKIWHHIDAAWGGLALWSKEKSNLFEGLGKADSLTMDFHKLMASTLTKGVFLTSHQDILGQANSGGGEEYIFQQEDSIDSGRYALQCGRKVDSLPLWLQWKLQGGEKYQDKIDSLLELSKWFTTELKANSNIKLLHEVEFLNHCFQLIPSNENQDVSDYNYRARKLVMERGHFMVNFASTPEHGYFFRIVFNHWGVDQNTLSDLLEELMTVKSILD